MLALGAFADTPTTRPAREDADAAPPWPPQSLLEVELLELQLGFEASYDDRRVHYDRYTPGQRSENQTNRSARFEETLGIATSGALLGPRIALFDIALEGGLSQERYDETGWGRDRHEEPSGSIFTYDLNFTFFPHGKISGTAFAKRIDSRVPRAFQPSLDRSLERYGGGLYLQDATFPMRLTFEHAYDTLTSRSGDLLDDEIRGRDLFRYEATWQIDPHHALELSYEYEDRREQYSGADTRFDTNRHYVVLRHILRFGPEHRSRWETLVRLEDESGELARDRYDVQSQLHLQHSDAWSTNWRAQFLREAYQQLATETWRLEGGATYQLEENLTATLQLYGLQQQAEENADFREWGGLANVSYHHDNPWGRLSANVAYNHAQTDTREGDRVGVIVNESVTFRDPLPAYLAQPDIVWGTIVVTNAARTRTYLAVRDYTIIRAGSFAALVRVPTGQIANNEAVLVSYNYRVNDDYDLRRDRLDFRIQQQFKFGLKPYYAASIQNESLDDSWRGTFRDRDVNRHRLGVEYRQPRWSAGLEFEFNDDSVDPYQALHARGDVVMWRNARNQLDGKAAYSMFWFDGTDYLDGREANLLDVGMTYRHMLARNLELQAATMYRYEDESLYGITHGVDVSGAVEWRIGYFSLRFEAEYDMLTLPDSDDRSAAVWLKLKREIPVIARKPQR
jgi:hypothetical protein